MCFVSAGLGLWALWLGGWVLVEDGIWMGGVTCSFIGEGRKGRKKRVGIGMISGPDGIWLIKCSTR